MKGLGGEFLLYGEWCIHDKVQMIKIPPIPPCITTISQLILPLSSFLLPTITSKNVQIIPHRCLAMNLILFYLLQFSHLVLVVLGMLVPVSLLFHSWNKKLSVYEYMSTNPTVSAVTEAIKALFLN